MITNSVYRVVYFLVHYLYSLVEAGIFVKNKCVEYYHEFVAAHYTSRGCSNTSSQKLNKTPAHVTVLLGTEEPSYKDLANIVLWCLSMGISFVSFYDYRGILKIHEPELMYAVEKRKPSNSHVVWHSKLENEYKNGFNGKKIHVKMLSDEDGRQSVVNLSKHLALSETNPSDCVNVEKIHVNLKRGFEFPDPDLGIYCGKTFSLCNYPPWQIRITEFLNIKSHHNVSLSTFLNVLQRYSKCEQRLGK